MDQDPITMVRMVARKLEAKSAVVRLMRVEGEFQVEAKW